MRLWRYMDFKYGIKSVVSGWFKLARLPELNDPNEMRGICTGELNEQVKREIIDEADRRRREGVFLDGRPVLPREEIVRNIREYAVKRLTGICMRRHSMEDRNRVLCFTRSDIEQSSSDQLFWAHYAKGGKGIRVLMDIDADSNSGYVLNKVQYSDVRPVLDVSKFKRWMDIDVFGQYYRECLFTKGLAWSYEQEVRLLVFKGSPLIMTRAKGEKCHDYIHFPPERILRVDFGPMTCPEDTEPIVEQFRQCEQMSHIEFHIAQFDDKGYGYSYPLHK